MHLKPHGPHGSLHQSLRKALHKANYRSQWLRCYSISSETQKDIGIIGGGVTGLTTAFTILLLHKRHYANTPVPKITIYESGSRLGGWIQSPTVKTPDGEEVVFEQGPRTLRTGSAASLITLKLMGELGLVPSLVGIVKSPALATRYVYYRGGLQQVPPSWPQLIEDAFSEDSLFKCVPPAILRDVFAGKRRSPDIEDESVGDFITRRFNRAFADRFATAMMHGIYAGDAWQLSAEAVLPRFWSADEKANSLILDTFRGSTSLEVDAQYLEGIRQDRKYTSAGDLEYLWARCAVFTLKGGLEKLTQALETAVLLSGSVDVKMKTAVESLKYQPEDNKIEVRTSGSKESQPNTHTHIISTVLAPTLSKMAQIPILSQTPAVTVGLVNLFYSDPTILRRPGFGYLIPNAPSVQNPTAALGVIFDSCVIPDKVPGTKLTVMLGGHLWSAKHLESASLDKNTLYEMAKQTLATQLGITTEPTVWAANLWRNAIPQYTVGHRQRMAFAHGGVTELFGGRLSVAGSSFNGVGVSDCIMGAKAVAEKVLKDEYISGLEYYKKKPVYVPTPDLGIV